MTCAQNNATIECSPTTITAYLEQEGVETYKISQELGSINTEGIVASTIGDDQVVHTEEGDLSGYVPSQPQTRAGSVIKSYLPP
jgi:hypothetical protein